MATPARCVDISATGGANLWPDKHIDCTFAGAMRYAVGVDAFIRRRDFIDAWDLYVNGTQCCWNDSRTSCSQTSVVFEIEVKSFSIGTLQK